MKKTLTVNISGIVFHIDDDAFIKLDRYLEAIRGHFSGDEGCDEIIAGIEGRIAEMFQEKVSSSKQVITLEDVREVIGQLGEPEQIIGDEDTGEKKKTGEPRHEEYEPRASKRLYRDPDDKYIGGVCSGLGAYFQVDPTWMRLLFIVAIFAGFGILLYIILWIVIPRARTTAEKLEMRGERVNLSNIEKSIKEDLQDIKKNLRDISEETRDAFKKKKIDDTPPSGLQSFLNVLVSIFGYLFKFIAAIVGIVLAFAGIILLITLIATLFALPFTFFIPFDFWWITPPFDFSLAFSAGWMSLMTSVALFLIVGVPLALLIYMGIKMIFDFESKSRVFGAVLFLLWMIGLAMMSFVLITAIFA